jgi:hypothetical protein
MYSYGNQFIAFSRNGGFMEELVTAHDKDGLQCQNLFIGAAGNT